MAPDVFISYAHADNLTADGKPGLITRLERYLDVVGHQKYGRKLEIFYDEKLASGQQWEKSIFDALASCRVFIPVISRSWARSEWAGIEWKKFLTRAQDTPELGDLSRIIPIAFELTDDWITRLQPEQRAFQFKRRFASGMSPDDFEKVALGVAQDLSDRLDKLDEIEAKKKVFLGFAFSSKMQLWKKNVTDNLVSRGYLIREIQYDGYLTSGEIKDAIQERAAGCEAVVHFLEDRPGPSASGDATQSLIQVQCEVALPKKPPSLRFFWTGPDLKIDEIQDEKYRMFLKGLSFTNEKVVEFTNSIRDELEVRPTSPPPPPDRLPVICLIYESGDQEIADEIQAFFAGRGWPVDIPDESVEQKDVPESFKKAFVKNKYFFFYWGQGKRGWCVKNYKDLIDARRQEDGNIEPPLAAVLYCGSEKEPYKEAFAWPWGKVKKYDRFDPTAPELTAFIRAVEMRANAAARSVTGQTSL